MLSRVAFCLQGLRHERLSHKCPKDADMCHFLQANALDTTATLAFAEALCSSAIDDGMSSALPTQITIVKKKYFVQSIYRIGPRDGC